MYTKGPWEIDYDNSDYSGGGQWYIVGPAKVWFSYSDDEKEAKANARLISKAPEMLELLMLCKYRFEEDGKEIYVQKIDKLITEIEGEQE